MIAWWRTCPYSHAMPHKTSRSGTGAVGWPSWALAIAVLAVLAAVLDSLPHWLLSRRTADWKGLEPLERLQLEATLRTALLQAVAGFVLLLGAVTAMRQLAVQRLQTRAAVATQYVDAFTRAVTQLTGEGPTVRVAGVYALSQLLRAGGEAAADIVEVLSRFIRQEPHVAGRVSPAAEVAVRQLALHGAAINVTGAALPHIDLRGLPLSGAVFRDCDLRDADLRGATLTGTDFSGANLLRVKSDASLTAAAATHQAAEE